MGPTSGEEQKTETTEAYGIDETLSFDLVSSNVSGYKSKYVKWGGRIFNVGTDKTFIQIYVDDDSEKNTLVKLTEPRTDLKEDDYVFVTGRIGDEKTYENVMGGKVTSLLLDRAIVEKTTRDKVAAPAKKVVNVGESVTQNNFNVTLEKIELAEDETRVYLRVKNESSETVSLYTYDAKIVQAGKQYERKSVWEAEDEFPDGDILPSVEVVGVVFFPKIEEEVKELTIFLDEPYGENWGKTWEMVKFSIVIPE